MDSYVLSCCSTSDLSPEEYKKRNIEYICFHYFLGDKEYVDDFGKTLSYKDFYQKMMDGVMTKTTQLNAEQYYEYFEKFLIEGKDILHVTLSSGLSGTYQSALIAKDMLKEKYKDRKILIVDSLAASSGYGLLMCELAKLKDEGMSIDELYKFANDNKLKVHHWFFSTDLKFYVRGGRISKSAGLIGNILHLCPVLNMSNEGRIVPRKKIIGKKRAIKDIIEEMVLNADKDYSDDCFICDSECIEDANRVKEAVEKQFPKLKNKVKIFNIGTTIGSHTGPGTVALFFFGKERIN